MALLSMKAIPAGMELFAAEDGDVWETIKRVIDECDLYIMVLGGRYGSVRADGTSFTEAEYRHAVDKGIPVLAFLHKNPESLPESRRDADSGRRERLRQLYDIAKQKPCGYWDTPDSLACTISVSLSNLRDRPGMIGWVRADQSNETDAKEIVALRRKVDELQAKVEKLSVSAPEGSEHLAQGEDEFQVHYTVVTTRSDEWGTKSSNSQVGVRKMTWNAIFRLVGPLMIRPIAENELQEAFNAELRHHLDRKLGERQKALTSDASLHELLVQLRALGLIQPSAHRDYDTDRNIYWVLTPHGDHYMTSLMALRRDAHPGK